MRVDGMCMRGPSNASPSGREARRLKAPPPAPAMHVYAMCAASTHLHRIASHECMRLPPLHPGVLMCTLAHRAHDGMAMA